MRGAGPGPAPPWGYEDKRRHDNGPLLDFGARSYDPLARQFLSIDPLRLEGAGDVLQSENTLQPFVYAAGNPERGARPPVVLPPQPGTDGRGTFMIR